MIWTEDVVDGATKIGEIEVDVEGTTRITLRAYDQHGATSEIDLLLDGEFYDLRSEQDCRELARRFKVTVCAFAQRLWETGQARLAGKIC